jgi:predicted  nucleic acid-binding Zn-ribbon protein
MPNNLLDDIKWMQKRNQELEIEIAKCQEKLKMAQEELTKAEEEMTVLGVTKDSIVAEIEMSTKELQTEVDKLKEVLK